MNKYQLTLINYLFKIIHNKYLFNDIILFVKLSAPFEIIIYIYEYKTAK